MSQLHLTQDTAHHGESPLGTHLHEPSDPVLYLPPPLALLLPTGHLAASGPLHMTLCLVEMLLPSPSAAWLTPARPSRFYSGITFSGGLLGPLCAKSPFPLSSAFSHRTEH